MRDVMYRTLNVCEENTLRAQCESAFSPNFCSHMLIITFFHVSIHANGCPYCIVCLCMKHTLLLELSVTVGVCCLCVA